MVEKVGEALEGGMSDEGVQVLLGPGTNLKRTPLCGRNFEYFSEDPYLSSAMATEYVRGVQSREWQPHLSILPPIIRKITDFL